MEPAEGGFGALVNRRALPTILLVLCGLCVLLTFAVGWFSTDATLRRWEYDESNAPNFEGAPIPPLYSIDLEMRMLSIGFQTTPLVLQQEIEARDGAPDYDRDAGRMGTVMLGILMLQFTLLVAFLAVAGFYYLQRRSSRDYSATFRRTFMVFFLLALITLVYFAVRIGPEARKDERIILQNNPFSEEVAYAPLEPDIGFWKTWRSQHQKIDFPDGREEVWQFTVESRPSAGWWLECTALLCALGARILAARNGDLEPADLDDEVLPSPPSPLRGQA